MLYGNVETQKEQLFSCVLIIYRCFLFQVERALREHAPTKRQRMEKILLPKPEKETRDDVLGFSESESSSEEEEDEEENEEMEQEEEEVPEPEPEPEPEPVKEPEAKKRKITPDEGAPAEKKKAAPPPTKKPSTFVPVVRPAEVQALREKLPILGEEQGRKTDARWHGDSTSIRRPP